MKDIKEQEQKYGCISQEDKDMKIWISSYI